MKIRELTNNNQSYFEINREERNYAAIFFTVLCKERNVEKFLKLCKIDADINKEEFGIYFEYSYLRDLWSRIGKNSDNEYHVGEANKIKKDIIREKLHIKNIDAILSKSILEINKYFGVGGDASEEYLQYPGKWAIIKYANNFDNDDFIEVCKFKWSFNIKPDIVIHLSKDRAICIEAKYVSSEGSYPSNEKDKTEFDKRGYIRVSQTELQAYMMNELLDIKSDFRTLVMNKMNSNTHQDILWSDAFDCMDLSGLPNFAHKMIENVRSE